MKRILSLTLVLLMLFSMSITAFAAEEQTTIDVYAKCEYKVEGTHPAPVDDGKAEIVTDDGVSVSVTDAPEGSLTLMVVPVPETEKEAWEWIESCLKDKADPVHTFNIYFEDADGNSIAADGAVVTINCLHCNGIPVVCSLDTDGTVQTLNRTEASGADISFTTDGSPYYVMAEKLPTSVIDPDSPQTGDNSNLWLWWLLLIVSATGVIILSAEQRKRRTTK